ncbi:hypothetical protein E4U43_005862 [Claviceps pusilla]|uniref:Arsenite transporter ARR3 n=1 Tax=Claviceps pusilla TaxID=123648 RepID=A0A9P7NEE1_9HYPO|nr:hypothetical protein E4U43_005862 [Claviceps pusilla]
MTPSLYDKNMEDPNENRPTSPPDTSRRPVPVFKSLGWLDRFLAVWIFLAMLTGILLGNFAERTGEILDQGRWVGVSIPIAIGLLVMMYPILCNVRYETLHTVLGNAALWKQVVLSLVLNWIVAPLFMLALAWAFLPDEPNLRSGLILVGLGRCIAMVLIWNNLAGGDPEYCAILVAMNSMLQMALFAPLAVLFISVMGDSDDEMHHHPSYSLVATSVGVFLGIPLGAAILTRLVVRSLAGDKWFEGVFMKYLSPLSLIGLLYTIVVLFAAQGKHVTQQVVSVVRVAAPLVVYFLVIFFATLWVTRRLGYSYRHSCTQSFTAASNNFELAIAVAVATFGADSQQALAATVGPLIEVPVLVGLVYAVKWIGARRNWAD